MKRRTFLTRTAQTAAALAASVAAPGLGWAIGPSSRFGIAQLQYNGDWNPRPNGLRKLLQEVEKRTSVAVSTAPFAARPEERVRLLERPLMFWCGTRGFDPLSQAAVDHLRAYLKAGGTLVVDCSDGKLDGEFERSVRRELARILPTRKLQPVPRSHVLYKSFFLIREPVGRVAVAKRLDGIFSEERLMVILSRNDLQGAWARDNLGRYEFDVFPGGERQREMSYRLGINIVMYALCLDYKEDQVHIPFILKRRRWKVD